MFHDLFLLPVLLHDDRLHCMVWAHEAPVMLGLHMYLHFAHNYRPVKHSLTFSQVLEFSKWNGKKDCNLMLIK